MEIEDEQVEQVTVLRVIGNIAESDIDLLEDTLLSALKNNKVVISMAKARSAETAEWQIANTLCKFANEATRQDKNIAIACLPSKILSKANQLMLGAKVRIFSQSKAAIVFLKNIAA